MEWLFIHQTTLYNFRLRLSIDFDDLIFLPRAAAVSAPLDRINISETFGLRRV